MQSKDIATIAVMFNKTNVSLQLLIKYGYRNSKCMEVLTLKFPGDGDE